MRPTRIVHLDVDLFWTLLTTRPHVCQRFLFSMATRLDRLQRRFVELTGANLRQQLAALLLDEHGSAAAPLQLTQATLAAMLAASRQSVNQVLKEFEAAGLIRLGYRSVEVVEVEGLTQLVG